MNYPVTTPYGKVPGYPLNNGVHRGIDYGYPLNTPVIVNGVTIGLSGSTGYSSGPHLHVGKWVNGVVQDPGVGNGFEFKTARVYDTGYDDVNGNWVKLEADGAIWVYLHLNKILVTKGQELEVSKPTYKEVLSQFRTFLGFDPTEKQMNYYVEHDWGTLNGDLLQFNTDRLKETRKALEKVDPKKLEELKKKLQELVNQI